MRGVALLGLLLAVGEAWADASLDEASGSAYVGVAAARGCGDTLAVWSERHIYLGAVGGGGRVLPAGPGVDAVAWVGCRALVARGAHLLVVDKNGVVERPLPLPRAKTLALVASGARVVWLGERAGTNELALLVSRDGGRDWRRRPPPERGNAGWQLALDADGTLHWMSGSEAACGGGGQWRHVARWDGAFVARTWPLDVPLSYGLGARGWAYGFGCEEGDALCAVHVDGARALSVPGVAWSGSWVLAADERQTLVADQRRLFRLRGAKAEPLPDAPVEPQRLELDGRGRPLVVGEGRLYRLERGAWRPLRPGG